MSGKIELSEFQKKILFFGFVYSFCRVKMLHLTPGEVFEIVNSCVDEMKKMDAKGGV